MKVLIVTPSYYPIVGGSEALTQTLCVRLNQIGIHTDIMTFNMNKKWHPVWAKEVEKTSDFRVLKIPALNPFSGFTVSPLDMLLRINLIPKPSFIKEFKKYDVIHFLGEADLSFPFFSFFFQKPKIMHCVATYPLFKYYKRHILIRRPLRRLFAHLADLYIVSSGEEKKLLLGLNVPISKLSVLPIGVDVDTFCPDTRKKLDNLLLFVGRIDRIKGVHILLESLNYIKIPTRLIVIGPKWDAGYVKEIEQMCIRIRENGVHTIKILPPVDRIELVPWYQKATIVVCPYLIETYSNITREALACGVPVVSTGKHIANNGHDGILISPKDPEKLASAITRLLKDRQMRKKYSKQGRKIAEQHLSWKSIVKDLAELYIDILTVPRETKACKI